MQSAAGSNVVTASPVRNAITGSISLTPQTYVDGALQPAKQVLPYTDFRAVLSVIPLRWKLILLVFIQVIFVTMVYGPIAAYLVEAFPAQDQVYVAVIALPHRQRRVRRVAAVDWTLRRGANRQHLRRFVLSDHRGRSDVRCGFAAAEGNQACADLGRDGSARGRAWIEFLTLPDAHVIQEMLFVTPVFFNFDEKLKMAAMAKHTLDILPRCDADLFQACGAFADNNLLL